MSCARAVSAVALVAALACRRSPPPAAVTQRFAVGARGDLVAFLFGPEGCDGRTANPPGVLRCGSDTTCEAIAPGSATVSCKSGPILVAVEVPARLEILGPDPWSRGILMFHVRATNAAGDELALGNDETIAWSFDNPLVAHANPGCSDVMPLCAPRNYGYAMTRGAGATTVKARFSGAMASKGLVLP